MFFRYSLLSLMALFAVSCQNSNSNSAETASAAKINADGSTSALVSLQDMDKDVYCFMQYNHSVEQSKNIPNDDTSAADLKQAMKVVQTSVILNKYPIAKNDLNNIYGANTSKIVEGNELAIMADDEFQIVKDKMIVAGGIKSEQTCESMKNTYITAEVNDVISIGLAGKRKGLNFKFGVKPGSKSCGWGSCANNAGQIALPR